MKSAAKKIRILLVEDHKVVREGMMRIINQEKDMQVSGEAGDAREALRSIEKQRPDMVITDISMTGMNGIEFLKHLKTQYPDIPAIVLSMHDEALYAERALRAGALAFVMKRESSDEVMAAIRKASRGEFHVSEKVGAGIFRKFLHTQKPDDSPMSLLSDRELEIFELLGRGRRSKEIAHELGLSVKTVDTHRAHIKTKLKLRNASELIQRAVQWVDSEGTAT
jgi:DNA-binding NarL/FixJ family response regulator